MKFRKVASAAGRGVMWALLPVAAWKRLVSTKESLGRISEMARRGKYVPRPEDLSQKDVERIELIDAGREIVLKLEEHERFSYMAGELGWDEEGVRGKMRELARAHTIRLCILLFTIVMTVGLTFKFGFAPVVYGSAAAMYLTATCVKTTCLYIQLEDRALWTMRQVVNRKGFWRRALWFLE